MTNYMIKVLFFFITGRMLRCKRTRRLVQDYSQQLATAHLLPGHTRRWNLYDTESQRLPSVLRRKIEGRLH